jgi:hypothetical protein
MERARATPRRQIYAINANRVPAYFHGTLQNRRQDATTAGNVWVSSRHETVLLTDATTVKIVFVCLFV